MIPPNQNGGNAVIYHNKCFFLNFFKIRDTNKHKDS